MNILIIARSTHFHFKSGGLETQLKNLAEGLKKAGNNITVLTTSLNHSPEKYESGVKYIFLNGTTSGFYPYSKWQKFLLASRMLTPRVEIEGESNFFDEIRKYIDVNVNSFDIIISQSTAARNLIGIKKRVVSIIHGTIIAELKSRAAANQSIKNWIRYCIMDLPELLIEKYSTNVQFFKRVDHIVAVSTMLKRQFLSEYPDLESKVTVIFNGVDSEKFKPANIKYKNFTLLYVGRVEREKGIDLTIMALKKLKDIDIDFKIVGNGSYLNELKDLTSQNKLTEKIQFISEVDNDKIVEYYQKSHLFIFPSRRQEGHPVTISEAFCCGLPVIASRNGGLNELIEEEVNGLHIDNLDSKELAQKIEYLYNNRKLLNDMGVKARDTGLLKYSQSSMVEAYDKLLKSL